MKNIKYVPNWLKWRENWSEIISVFFYPPPSKKKENNFVNLKKNESCPKLVELVCKLFGNNFQFFLPPLQIGAKKIRAKKSKLFQIDWNAEKTGRKLVFRIFDPQPLPICDEENFNKKNQICSKLAKKLVGNNFYL